MSNVYCGIGNVVIYSCMSQGVENVAQNVIPDERMMLLASASTNSRKVNGARDSSQAVLPTLSAFDRPIGGCPLGCLTRADQLRSLQKLLN